MRYRTVYLSVGTNLGDKIYNILKVIEEIYNMEKSFIIKISKVYITSPIGIIKQDDFLNLALKIKTKLKPFDLLKKINEIENKLGRERTIHWGPRIVDIDIIFYENLKINKEKLIIPHKEYKKRNFVLKPLTDLGLKKCLKYINNEKGKLEIYKYEKQIVISSCLLGIKTRYDGSGNLKKYLKNFLKSFYIVPICPEQLGGMETPRNPVEMKNGRIIDKDKKDYTDIFLKGANESFKISKIISSEIVILKSKSPSCGFGKIYNGNFEKKIIKGNGITADLLDKNNIKIISI